MTGVVGIFLAIAAGLIVSSRRQLAIAIVVPFVAVLIVQTWRLAAGHGVSPPSTVNAFPQLIGYYLVQVIILGLALLDADLIRIRIARRPAASAGSEERRRQTSKALVINVVLSAVVVQSFYLERALVDPGSVNHHTAGGSPPLVAMLCMLASVLVLVVLGTMTLLTRRTRSRSDALGQPIGQPVGQVR
jgi:hypothetical protein